MVIFTKPSTRKALATKSTPRPVQDEATSELKYLSDIAAGRKSTHPDSGTWSPAKRVFRTFELCEMVLDKFDLLDLVRAKGICRAVKDTIKASPKLQIKLFLKPAPDKDCRPWVLTIDDHLLAGDKALQAVKHESKDPTVKPLPINIYAFSPIFFHVCQTCAPHGVFIPAERMARAAARNVTIGIDSKTSFQPNRYHINDEREWSSFKPGKTASCCSMYLSQPPAREVALILSTEPQHYENFQRGTQCMEYLSNPSGVTFGEVIDKVHSHALGYRGHGPIRFDIRIGQSPIQGSMAVSLEEREWVHAMEDVTEESDIFAKEWRER
ncbi:hypothetical protein LTR56_010220 [Elasticomyces elasticus]|nr:hypothetical protein LTR22_017230 [Elasticomyces elasticus]KAK3643482.1 hypothetical protein LTR56_010220 [Elasticomyces elasticus]KAK4925310.1 hypothetical protein LTR49_007608 [Elasticomyces elasticus]KAK5761319.1 hypothetical protein LTS12_008595 [Elasticomyces elasticus]